MSGPELDEFGPTQVLRDAGQQHPATCDDGCDALAASQAAPVAVEAAHERRRQGAGAADGHRESMALSEHRHQPAEAATSGGLGGQVGVEGIASQQRATPFPRELLLTQAAHRQGQVAGEPKASSSAELRGEAESGAERGKGREHGLYQVRPDTFPHVVHVLPGACVGGCELCQSGRGVLHAALQNGAPPVPQRVGQHTRGVAPPQSFRREVETGEDR
ncbi:hypothetical protein SAMN05446589_1654 [Streptomyces sp. OV198]|nr:hypothetical protein SAMN05446589_1654 [Streptomyces sp. OV198]